MKYGLATLVLVLIAGAVAYAAVQANMDQYSWNYKITVNIETPEGVKTGSAVRQVLNRDNTLFGKKIPEAPSRLSAVKGEAVVIDLGERGVVFGLIEHGSYGELYAAFPTETPASLKGVDYYNSLPMGAKAELPKENWPKMAMFSDIDDPKSVKAVNKLDLSKTFGNGYSWKSITIQIVNEPVTWGIVDRYLSDEFWQKYRNWTKSLNIVERARQMPDLFEFKQGEQK